MYVLLPICHNCFPLLRVSNISTHTYECYLFIHFKFLSVTLRLLLEMQVFHLFKFYSGNVSFSIFPTLLRIPEGWPVQMTSTGFLVFWLPVGFYPQGDPVGGWWEEECEGIYSLSLLPRVLISCLNIHQNSCQVRPLQMTFSLWFWYLLQLLRLSSLLLAL